MTTTTRDARLDTIEATLRDIRATQADRHSQAFMNALRVAHGVAMAVETLDAYVDTLDDLHATYAEPHRHEETPTDSICTDPRCTDILEGLSTARALVSR